MHRCIELARLGAGNVAPNPMVGAVLVYNDRIIGEGYHRKYGEAHAEVNCIHSVKEADSHLIEKSTLYVSLEPCAHFGKTPPCADLIIEKKIPLVVIGCRDSFEQVDGKGIQKLLAAGITVITPVLEKQALELNKRFFTFYKQRRPYIILKWAQTINGKIANSDYSRLLISNETTNRKVHKWRSTEAAILVGTNTALHDNPSLTTRLWSGSSPVRLVIDRQLKLPSTLHLFNGIVNTIVFNAIQQLEKDNLLYYKISNDQTIVAQILEALYQLKIQSVLVEGGAKLIQSFIDENYWDETITITNTELSIQDGVTAPSLKSAERVSGEQFYADRIDHYKHI
jgi:diaminohydroxyphosphoribosylaminopyrimidine deaminase / 5-amino-6-(5-phosphoribosylamino)uracil reductase